jgi:hypothetical protein
MNEIVLNSGAVVSREGKYILLCLETAPSPDAAKFLTDQEAAELVAALNAFITPKGTA